MEKTNLTFAGVEFDVRETSFRPVNTRGPALSTLHSKEKMMEIVAEWINEAQDKQRNADTETVQEAINDLVFKLAEDELA